MNLVEAHKKRIQTGGTEASVVSLTPSTFGYGDTPYQAFGVTKDNKIFMCRRVTSGGQMRILNPDTMIFEKSLTGSINWNANNSVLLPSGEIFTVPHTYNANNSRRRCYTYNSDTDAITLRVQINSYFGFVGTPQIANVILTPTGKVVLTPSRFNSGWLVVDPDNSFSVVANAASPMGSADYSFYSRGCFFGDSVYSVARLGNYKGIVELNYVTNTLVNHPLTNFASNSEYMDISRGPDDFGYMFPYIYTNETKIIRFNFSTNAVTEIEIPAVFRVSTGAGCLAPILLKNGLYLIIPRVSGNPAFTFNPFTEEFVEVPLDRNVIGDDIYTSNYRYIGDKLFILRNVASETGNYGYLIDTELTYGNVTLDNSVPSDLSTMPNSDFNKHFNR